MLVMLLGSVSVVIPEQSANMQSQLLIRQQIIAISDHSQHCVYHSHTPVLAYNLTTIITLIPNTHPLIS